MQSLPLLARRRPRPPRLRPASLASLTRHALRGSLAVLVALGLLLSSACSGDRQAAGDGKQGRGRLEAVATVGMITDIVRQIGGEHVSVIGLMGPGIDPHLYKASAGDVARMQRADIIFYNGLHLEGAMAELFERMRDRTRTVAVAERIPPARLLSDSSSPKMHDPHVWFDVSLWREAARAVEDALVAADSLHAGDYRRHAAELQGALAELDRYVRQRAQELAPEQRVLITAHDAFHYFGRAYGFKVHGLQGISTVTEAGTSDVQELTDFIVARRVPAIFVESSVPPRTIEALQAAVRARGFEVAIGGELFSDAMGDPATPEGNYIGMVRHNIDTIVDALEGKAGE